MSSIEPQITTSNQNQGLKSSIEEKMTIFCKSICIYKVPEEPSFDNRSVFVPVKVSIGPFHHGNSILKQMEDLKWCYLSSFLKRGSAQQNYLKDIVDVIAESEKRVRQCYNVEFVMDSKEFNQMLLLDCCFILELLLRFFIKSPKCRTDPIFTTPGLLFHLRLDMILLENQVPLFLLKDILEKHPIPRLENNSLNDLTFRFFRRMIAGERQCLYNKFMQEADHFLDMVHYCFLSSYPRVETKDNAEPKPLSSASILLKKGIRFKAARNTNSLLDIKFQNGVLEIPTFKVYQRSESILMNLIAYERCQFGTTRQVQSYVCLMSHLLESDKDVKLLCQRKILTDNENDKLQIAQNLKWMSQQKCLSDAYFAGVIQQIDESSCRCVGLGRMRIRTLIRNPFVIGAGAILVVGMIFVAAFFSAVTFLRHRYV